MNDDRVAHCQAAVDAFVGQGIKADEFLRRLKRLWHRDADGPCVDRILLRIQALCAVYAHDLPEGAGYRVSEEQFRSEVRRLAAWRCDEPEAP